MWIGGVRAVILDEKKRILMLKQHQDGKDIWMVPGGNIEENENAVEATIREVKEETGLDIEVERLIWHVEEVSSDRGQRFVNFFLTHVVGGNLTLGRDPERGEGQQVMEEVMFMSKTELEKLELVYPSFLRDELWVFLLKDAGNYNCFKVREQVR